MPKRTTGRFDTRAELTDWIWRAYLHTPAKVSDIAVQCRVSEGTVHKIIKTKEGDPEMKTIGTITIAGEQLVLRETTYAFSDRIAIVVRSSDGSPFAALTVNLPEHELPEGCIFVKTWSENEILREPALATGLFEDTGARVSNGFVDAEVWKYQPT